MESLVGNAEQIFSPSEVSLEIVRIEKLWSSRSDLCTLNLKFHLTHHASCQRNNNLQHR
jgi:hypothetical protein